MTESVRFVGSARPAQIGSQLAMSVNGSPLAVPLSTFGPGDIVGIESAEVLRRVPAPGSVGHSPNMFPFVELRHADFPWRVSPGAGQLAPWLVLVVFEAAAVELARKPGAPLPVIETAASALPALVESSAWAHAQFSGDPTVPIETIADQSPDRCLARLVAARQLAPRTRYLACIVPAFEAGRLAGVGKPVSDPMANAPAWTTGNVELPVYDSWTFTTGEAGDFETLARRLRPVDLAARARPWTIDVSAVAGPTAPVAMPSALRPVGADTTWTGTARDAARTTLAGWLQAEATTTGPVIGPPLYGGLAAGMNKPAPGWLEQLSCDPRLRAVAALGAGVARADQERVVADAWDQVGQLRRANRERDGAALSALLVPRLAARHLAPAGASALPASRVAWARVKVGTQTVAARVAASTMPQALSSAAFRRIASVRVRGTARALATAVATFNERPSTRGQLPPTPVQLVTPAKLAPSHVHIGAAATTVTLAPAVLSNIHAVVARTIPVLRVPRPLPLEIGELSTTLVTALASPTALARFSARFDRGDLAHEPSTTAPIVSEIDLPYSLVQPLAARDRRFILGGVDVPGDSVGMLEPDATFIEAALVGASHELVRELQWRGAPVDRRVTPFKHFFDARGAAATDDITAVATWQASDDLGRHLRDRDAAVIIVCGELVRRFPDALIYLAKAQRANGRRSPGDEHRLPRFRGALSADSVFVGFDRTADQLRNEDGAGWYVVLAEHAGGPRFGLDEPGTTETLTTWNDLSWADVKITGAYVAVATSTPLPTSPGDYHWGRDGGHMAAITLQRPVSVAIHAAGLLPARTS